MISKKNILVLEARRIIYNFILRYPGIHIWEISRDLNIPKTTLRHHLKFLENEELIVKKSQGRYIRYYISEEIGTKDKELFSMLRQDVPMTIILFLVVNVLSSRIELSRSLEKHPNTIGFHLKKLLNANVIEIAPIEDGIVQTGLIKRKTMKRNTVKNEVIYRLTDIHHMYDLIITNKKSILEDSTISYILEMKEYYNKHGYPREFHDVTHFGSDVDILLNVLFDIFPHPYHV